MMFRFHRLSLALLAFLLIFPAAPGWSMGLREAKSTGLVGERPDGLVGAVETANDDVAALISRVNAARIAKYEDIASRNGTSPQAVQSIAGKELIGKAPPGTLIMDESGTWYKK